MVKLQKNPPRPDRPQPAINSSSPRRSIFSRTPKKDPKAKLEAELNGHHQTGVESTSTLVVRGASFTGISTESVVSSAPKSEDTRVADYEVPEHASYPDPLAGPVTLASSRQFSRLVTGETLHQFLWHDDSEESDNDQDLTIAIRHPLSRLPDKVWDRMIALLSPSDAANFTLLCRSLRGMKEDRQLPNELLCFVCRIYHQRREPGQERLRPSHTTNPDFRCPNARRLPLPRTRLTDRQDLPYYLVQLAMRAQRYSPQHGIPLSHLNRFWKCRDSDWTHRARFHVHKGHLLLRVISTSFARAQLTPSEERLLLFSRHDYLPYFSVCDHWQNGDLMKLAKCALSHVPAPKIGLMEQLREGPRIDYHRLLTPDYMPKQCHQCKPMRRCPQCPTEYLIEIKIVEDKRAQGIERFKHAICVTRWSDLGNGSSPSSIEWAAINGKEDYDSFGAVRNASLCSLFEAATNNYAPNQQLLSLGNRKGRTGDHVY